MEVISAVGEYKLLMKKSYITTRLSQRNPQLRQIGVTVRLSHLELTCA